MLDWGQRPVWTIAVTVSLPPGWRPPSMGGAGELFGDPRFLDNEHFTLPLPTGEARTYHVHADGE